MGIAHSTGGGGTIMTTSKLIKMTIIATLLAGGGIGCEYYDGKNLATIDMSSQKKLDEMATKIEGLQKELENAGTIIEATNDNGEDEFIKEPVGGSAEKKNQEDANKGGDSSEKTPPAYVPIQEVANDTQTYSWANVDLIAPEVVEYRLQGSDAVKITFSEPMKNDASLKDSLGIAYYNVGQPVHAVENTSDPKVFIFKTEAFVSGKPYRFLIKAGQNGPKDLAGNSLKEETKWEHTFTPDELHETLVVEDVQTTPGKLYQLSLGAESFTGMAGQHADTALRCPKNEVVVGYEVRSGDTIDFISFYCNDINNLDQNGSLQPYGSVGGTGGSSEFVWAPKGHVMSGFKSGFGIYQTSTISSFLPLARKVEKNIGINNNEHIPLKQKAFGTGPGNSFLCQEGAVLVGFYAGSEDGSYVNGLQGICAAVIKQ